MVSPPPDLSVVIPTYAEGERLCACLQSLSRQNCAPARFEVIAVDDASPDFDPEALRRAAGPLDLQLLRLPQNQGRARARNAGLRRARGEIAVFLDGDMTVEPDFLAAHAQAHQDHPNAVVIGNIRNAAPGHANGLARYMESRGVHRLGPQDPVPFKCFVTGNSSVLREHLLRVGFFDEAFTAYGGEDLELGYRLHRAGMAFHYAPRALSHHHHLRPLGQLCQLMHTYGRHSLPLMLERHPALAGLLHLDFVDGAFYSPRRLLLHLALHGAVCAPLRWLAESPLERWAPSFVFSYLLWRERTRGFLEARAAAP